MEVNDNILFRSEKIIFSLRDLFVNHGYKPYKLKKFDEYGFYSKLEDYLVSKNVITFVDTNGQMMALKPDVTLSIVKAFDDNKHNVEKLCYNEQVYRIFSGNNRFKESSQAGIECLGNVDFNLVAEVVYLAYLSLNMISDKTVLILSDLDILNEMLSQIDVNKTDKDTVVNLIVKKNFDELKKLAQLKNLDKEKVQSLIKLCSIHCTFNQVIDCLSDFNFSNEYLLNLNNLNLRFNDFGISNKIYFDFSISNDIKYYNGIVFKGYVEGIPSSVITGGQYDKLMKRLGKKSKAVGMAVYMDFIDYYD